MSVTRYRNELDHGTHVQDEEDLVMTRCEEMMCFRQGCKVKITEMRAEGYIQGGGVLP